MSDHRRGMVRDFGLNILASALLTGATQLVVYPGLSRMIEPDEYGALLTTMAVVNVIGTSLGGSLNNTRILLQGDYDSQGVIGDYNMIFAILVMVALPLATATLAMTGLASGVNLAGSVVVAVLVLWRAYYSASYRIRIDYLKNLLASGLGVVGYSLGMVLAKTTGYWSLAFITGELFACVYIALTGHIVRESMRRTGLLVHTLRRFAFLLGGTVLGALNLYLDRLLVYPLLGASEVSTFVVASFLGKSIGLLMGPVAGVQLTYYAKATGLSRSEFLRQLGLIAAGSVAGYAVVLVVGKPLTNLLYPTIAASAMPYLAVANLASIVFVAAGMIHPVVLRFCDAKWQPVIQGGYLLAYLGFGAYGTYVAGLWGLCWAVLGVNVVRCVVMIVLVLRSIGGPASIDGSRGTPFPTSPS